MEPYQLDHFQGWFDTYTNRFLGKDEYVDAHLNVKQEHTRRTCEEILFLAGRLALDDNQKRIAETAALFHDLGRFPQFSQYRTYNDARSVDHARLSVEILRQEGVLASLRREERQWVQTAIEHHGRKSLPDGLTGQALLFAKLLRDADKLDILRVVVEIYQLHRADPAGHRFEIELPDEPRYSPEVFEAVMSGQLIEYTKLHTLNDMRLCQIGWVHDLNFAASLERLKERGFLDRLFEYLPQTADIARLRAEIHAHIEARLSEASAGAPSGPLGRRANRVVERPGPKSR
jgi:HD superfamily phosphohydrolase YqeK